MRYTITDMVAAIRVCDQDLTELRQTIDHFQEASRRSNTPDKRIAEWQAEYDQWKSAKAQWKADLQTAVLRGVPK